MTREEREQMEIQQCLNCPFPECWNCQEVNGCGGVTERTKRRIFQLLELHKKGLTDLQISDAMHVSTIVVGNLRRQAGLNANPTRHGRAARV